MRDRGAASSYCAFSLSERTLNVSQRGVYCEILTVSLLLLNFVSFVWFGCVYVVIISKCTYLYLECISTVPDVLCCVFYKRFLRCVMFNVMDRTSTNTSYFAFQSPATPLPLSTNVRITKYFVFRRLRAIQSGHLWTTTNRAGVSSKQTMLAKGGGVSKRSNVFDGWSLRP